MEEVSQQRERGTGRVRVDLDVCVSRGRRVKSTLGIEGYGGFLEGFWQGESQRCSSGRMMGKGRRRGKGGNKPSTPNSFPRFSFLFPYFTVSSVVGVKSPVGTSVVMPAARKALATSAARAADMPDEGHVWRESRGDEKASEAESSRMKDFIVAKNEMESGPDAGYGMLGTGKLCIIPPFGICVDLLYE